MKLRKMVERMEALLSKEKRSKRRQGEDLKELLKRLKKKERKLQKEADAEKDPKLSSELAARIKVVRAQRNKGVKALKTLRRA